MKFPPPPDHFFDPPNKSESLSYREVLEMITYQKSNICSSNMWTKYTHDQNIKITTCKEHCLFDPLLYLMAAFVNQNQYKD